MKKLLSLMLIVVIIMGSFVSIGFGEGKKVSKVVFRGMSSTQTYTALGKIRLYNGDTLIEAGNIIVPPKDVNNTGTFTLGDLSIACYLLDSDSSTWGNFTPDVDNSGAVDTLDLSKIVEEILKN